MPAPPGTTQKNPDPTGQDEAAQDISPEVERLVHERTEEIRKENDALRRENAHLRRTETTLRESEAKYRVVADFTYDWEEWIDPEGSYVYVSPSCERITGYSVADFTADPMLIQRITHPEDQKVLEGHTEEFHTNGTEPADIDFRIVTKSGEIRWISHYCQPVYSAEGVFRGRRGSNRDITKRKRAEEALRKAYAELDDRVRERTAELEHANTRLQIEIEERKHVEEGLQESKEKLRPLFDSLPIGISVLDTDRKIREVNPALGNILDISQEDLMHGAYTGRRYLRSDGTEMPMAGYPSVRAFEEQKAVHNVEIGVVKEDGTTIWTNVSAVPLPFSDWRVLVTTSDITERKRVEEALRSTSDYLESLINYANAPIIVWDSDHTITRFNNAFERLTEYSAGEVVGRKLDILFSEDTRDESLAKIQRSQTEHWESIEIPILRKDGDMRIALWNSANIYDEKGDLLATIAQGQDITKRKQAEKALQRRTDDLIGLNQEVEAAREEANMYLDIMTHDVRNANNVSSMYADLMTELAEGTLKTYVEKLHDSVERSSEILQNVATIRRAQHAPGRLLPVNLDAAIREEIDAFPGATIRYRVPPVEVLADGLLPTVFNNLISNAVKFGGPDVEISIHVEEQDGEMLVSVEDTGPGVPEEMKEILFHRFERGMAKGRGEGLGLFIVRTLVTRYGGTIWIEDRMPGHPEEGATFRFTLRKAGENS